MTTTTHAASRDKTDPRTSSTIALDDTAAWLRERVPDRLPHVADPSLLALLANPSLLSAVASEYGRRLTAELHGAEGFAGPRGLKPLIDRLPAAILMFNPSADELESLRRQIDAQVHALRNPPAAQPLPREWLDAARELGITLPVARNPREESRARSEAEDMIHREYARRLTDKRLQPVALLFRKYAIAGGSRSSYVEGPRPLQAKRARHALAATQVLPPVEASSPFAATEAELRSVAAFVATPTMTIRIAHFGGDIPRLNEQYSANAEIVGAEPPQYYGHLVTWLGERMPQLERGYSFKREYEAVLEKWRDRPPGVPQASRDERERAFRAEMQPLIEKHREHLRKRADDWRAAFDEQRRRVVATFDAKVANMPIGPAWYHTRNVRDGVATFASSDNGEVALMQSYGVRVELAR